MAARKKTSRPSARSGKFGVKHALIAFVAGALTCVVVALIVIGRLKGTLPQDTGGTTSFAIIIGVVLGGGVAAGVAYGLASSLSARLTNLSLAVSKMGRGSKASIRVAGNDEITVLGRMLSALSSEMAGQDSDASVATAVDSDPHVRELRDKTLSDGGFDCPEGYEIDAAYSAGTRGGTDYFDCHASDGRAIMYMVSVGGGSAAAVVAARMARDEIERALTAGADARKALSHTNRVLHKAMPRGICALATMVEVGAEQIMLYQAGSRVPAVLCVAGALEDLTAEGLALGLDSGPVFEKGLRPNELEMASGMRLVLLNDAGNRSEELIEFVQEHSPKHTAPFMNMVLGELEGGAGPGGLREDVVLMTLKRS